MRLIEVDFSKKPGMGTALAALLLEKDQGQDDSFLLYRPGKEVLFSGLDLRSPSFLKARDASQELGFLPVKRASGGRAIVFHPGCLAVSWTTYSDDALGGIDNRFEVFSTWVRDALRSLGLGAEIGELPGEYCPGEWSVHVDGKKVAGVAQRVTPPGAQVSAVINLAGAETSNSVLAPVYEALQLPLDLDKTGEVGLLFGELAEEIKQQIGVQGPSALWSQEMLDAISLRREGLLL